MKIGNWYHQIGNLWPRPESAEIFDLQSWRNWFIKVLLYITILIFPLSMMVTFPILVMENNFLLLFLDIFFWLFLIYMFFSKRFSYNVNAFVWLAVLYTFTIVFFIILGPHHARSGWLVLCAVMAALFFGTRAAIISVFFNALLLMMFYGLIDGTNPAWSLDFAAPFGKWVMFVINISIVTLLASLPVGLLLMRLDMVFRIQRRAREQLSEEKKKLEESEERYRQMVDNANDMISGLDLNGHFTYLNPYATKIFGYSGKEMYGKHVLEIVRSDYRKEVENFYREQFQKKIPNTYYEFPGVTKDGKVIWVGQNMQMILEGSRIVGFQGMARDVTERKKAEKELQESKEKYQLLFENANDAIFIVQDGLIKFPNPKLIELSGYTETELATKPFVEFLHPEDSAKVQEFHRKRMTGEIDVPSTYSFRALSKAGQELFIELSVVFILWEGHPASLNFARDISQQKQMELQLLQAQKMEAVGTLAGGIAHDFNNSLQAILGYTQILLIESKEKSGDADILRQIEKAALRSKELTQQLLTYSRKVESKLSPVKLNQEVHRLETILRRTIPRMIDIRLVLAEDLHIINADATQMEQVLMNLCINARDAMPDGGTLTIETENISLDEDYCRIHLGAAPGDFVLMSISDTGIGMDKNSRERIFEPFYTTKEKGKGTGLGLAMVYGIVKSHGGYIMCYSEPGEGTIFKIYFPVLEGQYIEHSEPEKKTEIRGGSETILLVDDENFIREIAEKILVRFGYRVFSARDGEKALEIFREQKGEISLVLLDLIMPGMGGKKCLEEILKIDPSQKVIIASGYSANGQTRESLNLGAKGYLKKPYELDSMLALIRDVLDKK